MVVVICPPRGRLSSSFSSSPTTSPCRQAEAVGGRQGAAGAGARRSRPRRPRRSRAAVSAGVPVHGCKVPCNRGPLGIATVVARRLRPLVGIRVVHVRGGRSESSARSGHRNRGKAAQKDSAIVRGPGRLPRPGQHGGFLLTLRFSCNAAEGFTAPGRDPFRRACVA